ncbi:TraV family lipoprotein [Tistrella sp.]|uniref:TraV family lipoprotein n=1 Tax=Tistrella sp. TaxID=2024861 RepID=UPI003A5BF601
MYEATNGPSQSLPVAGAPIVNVAAPVATAAPAVTVIEPVPAEVVNVVPFRSQPVVMRIWVAPWESDAGDLHLGGSLLVEVEPRRWQVGNVGASEQGAIFSPLRKHR